ncbi:unnamed protein product [Effrenium voratum]|nr:unnamed protein product [Effrenium voratum]CAJ1416383.1 unnamed protein product [Effrenium voratum]
MALQVKMEEGGTSRARCLDLEEAPAIFEFLPVARRRSLCKREHGAVQSHVEPHLERVRRILKEELELREEEFRQAYDACTVEICFGLACGTVLWRNPSLSLLVFPVIGTVAGLLSFASMLPCGLKSVLAWRRVRLFNKAKAP